MRAGRLDRRITLQSFTLSEDGDPTSGSWSTVSTVWAQKLEKSQIERFVSEAEIATAVRVYRIRYNASIDPTWRIVDGTELWDIEGTPEGPGRHRETLILCSRHDPGDRSG